MKRCLTIAFALVMLLASAARAATSDVATEHGFARLAVDWPAPVTLMVETRAAGVDIRASQPFPADLSTLATALGGQLESARLNDSATVLELRARTGFGIETEILDDRSLRIALAPTDALQLGLRFGRHADFERVVIEPVRANQMRLGQDDSRLTVTLPGALTAADRAELATVAGIERVAAVGNQLFLDLAPGAHATPLFVEPDRQVLDIYPAGGTAPGPTSHAAAGPAVSPPAGPAASGQIPSLPSELAASADRSGYRKPTRAAAPWTSQSFSTLTIAAERIDDDRLELGFTWPEPVPAAVFVRGARLWIAFAADAAEISLDRETFSRAGHRFISALREESHSEATLIRFDLIGRPAIEVRRDEQVWRITLAGAEAAGAVPAASGPDTGGRMPLEPGPTGAAHTSSPGLFLPGIDAVLSLDDPLVGDRLGIGMARSPTAESPIRESTAPARFVGLRLLPAVQGAVWRRLSMPVGKPKWTTAGLYLDADDGVVRTARTRPSQPAPLIDILPMALDVAANQPPPPPTDVADATDDQPVEPATVTETALPSDDPAVAPANDQAAAIRETGSIGSSDEQQPEEQDEQLATPGLLDLARLSIVPRRRFFDHRTALLDAAAQADRQDPTSLALELARLHVAHGLGAEAVALLDNAPSASGSAAGSPARQALHGAALFLAGRYESALEHLVRAEVEADDEAALWRGATLAALEQWDEALGPWRRGAPWLAGYTASNQAALGEHGIMLLLQTGRVDEAFALLEQLAARRLPTRSRERLRELEAVALERDGAIEEARTIWRSLMAGGSAEARSRALAALTFSDLEAGRIDADLAVDQLIADSVHWRGQRDEVAKRRRLAALQRSAGMPEAALTTLEDALSGAPRAEVAAAITDDMAAIVDGFLQELVAGERSATETLLLYRRYIELVAPGPAGDAKVVALGESLSELGFEDVAIDILRARLGQSELRGAGRAALGFALAELLARQGDGLAAMSALVDSTPIDAIDEGLAKERLELFRAIGEAGDSTALETSTTRDRARQAFDRRAWPTVIEATRTLEAELPTVGALDTAASETVLLAAIAARQQGDELLVDRLVATYEDRLATPTDDALLALLAKNARFAGAAGDVLAEATSYARAMRGAIRRMPSL